MTWTDEDPGAGDVDALRHLAGRLDTAAQGLSDVRWDLRSQTGSVTDQAWAGAAGDAWRQSGEACVENVNRLIEEMAPASGALAAYAARVEEIAEEAARARRRKQDAVSELIELDAVRKLMLADSATPSRSGSARPRWNTAREDALAARRTADRLMAELVDRRIYADAQVRAELGTVRVGEWPEVGQVYIAAPQGGGLRATLDSDVVAGGVALGQTILGTLRLWTKGTAYAQFLRAATAPVTSYPAMLRNSQRAYAALDTFMHGKPGGGLLGKVIGSRAASIVGRAFVPTMIATGVRDAATGGGYDGARGWAARAFGLGGAMGAAALIGASTGLLVLGPVGVVIAGAAVLAYGAWSLGDLVWDHREEIGAFLTAAGGAVRDTAATAWNATNGAVSDAVDWAGSQIGKVTDSVSDLGKGALHVLSFGAL